MRDEIEAGYRLNLQRVRKLVQVYRDLAVRGLGRRPVEATDVLRAAVVLLHATLEDFLRNLLVGRWALTTDTSHFEDIHVAIGPDARQAKLTLAELATLRGKTVADIVQASIEAHLDRSTFNHVGDVKTAVARSGIDAAALNPHASSDCDDDVATPPDRAPCRPARRPPLPQLRRRTARRRNGRGVDRGC
jgi:hypothetical protein